MASDKKNTDKKTRVDLIEDIFRLNPFKKYTVKGLASQTGGADRTGKESTYAAVEKLLEKRIIQQAGTGKYKLHQSAQKHYEGVVEMIASGSFYVVSDELEADVYISTHNSAHALNGDKVSFVITRIGKGGKPEGEIVSIVERNKKNYVGVAIVTPSSLFVSLDSRKVPYDIHISNRKSVDVENGDKVLVSITDWPENQKNPNGIVLNVFGKQGDNDAEMHSILAEYDLPYKFDADVVDDANAIAAEITEEDYASRRDMREIVTFTIDPADAKDFDDALSLRQLQNGNWEVGVHIADVTHYVREESIVEAEAKDRATSVYLVDRTVPMLPERLSNELCSLRPNEEKLTFSAVFELDDDANILNSWFGRTVILSDRRFTYEEAQQVIETGEGDYRNEITTLNRLARIMRGRRFAHGAIAFEREEAKFILDENGKPLGVYFKDQKESNKLIEEFMLLANKSVAEYVGKKKGKEKSARTFVYRVHDKPNPDKLSTFKNFILKFGYYIKAEKGKALAQEMNTLMGKIHGKYEENVISTLAVRTMAKAYYTTDNIGHYGLAFDFYTHFTSPIRRYPDMMVHRLLAHYLSGGKSEDKAVYEKMCEHSSAMEIRASEAERSSIKYKMAEFMLDKIGMEFDGHISGVTEWGVYVELDENHIEGMVPVRELKDDVYYFDEESYALVGKTTDTVLTLGDAVRIKVIRADLARKQIDFSMLARYDFKTGEAIDISERTYHVEERTGKGPKSKKKRSRK